MIKKQFVSAYKGLIFNLSARNSYLFKFYYKHLYNPSKNSLSYFYDKVSRHLEQVYVIQIGANDGINHDPIHKFVKRDGWKGVLVEPQPEVFRHQLFPLYRRNRGIYMENIALSNEIGLLDMYRISFSAERWATGLTTFNKPTLQAKVDSGDIDSLAKRRGVKTPANKADYISRVKVEAKTFELLRHKYEIGEVDVLQIDVEGYDFEIIKLYDLKVHKPKVVVFECRHLKDAEYKEATEYFQQNGYLMKRVKGDSVAVRNDFEFGTDLISSF